MAVALTHLAGQDDRRLRAWRGADSPRCAPPSPAARPRSSSGTTRTAAREEAAGARRARPPSRRLAVDEARQPGPFARRAAHAPGAASDRRYGEGGGCRDHLRHRASVARGGRPGALRRDHRHQRKVDDDGADRACARGGRLPTSVGGNIGRAALDLEPPAQDRIYVLEMSSYQLDLTRRFRPDVAVWLNLTPDHLDRHGDLRGYAKAKARIFVNMARRRKPRSSASTSRRCRLSPRR